MAEPLPIFEIEPHSDLFRDVFSSRSGHIVRDCSCGRVHFEDDERAGTWDDGELEKLRANAIENPDKYRGDSGSVTGMEVGGVFIADGCPCNRGKRFENFILHHQALIAEYLNRRAELLVKEAAAVRVAKVPA